MSLGGACASSEPHFPVCLFVFARAIVNFSAGDVDLHILGIEKISHLPAHLNMMWATIRAAICRIVYVAS